MNLVEELCDRILLIDEGKALLYGSLTEIKRDFAPNSVRVRAAEMPADLPGVAGCERQGDVTLLTLDGIGAQELLAELVERNVEVESFERAAVPLNDIFVAMVQGKARFEVGAYFGVRHIRQQVGSVGLRTARSGSRQRRRAGSGEK